jgi:GT2 family glycosyltransferase
MDAPDISIVVCTHNRAASLRGALASLADLATDDQFTYEIVVIDNASTDDTQRVIAEAAANSRALVRGVYESQKGIVPARNRGVAEARGRWIAFFDDDQLADRRWLFELYRGAHDRYARVVGGSVLLKIDPGDHVVATRAGGQAPRRLHPAVRMLLGEADHGDRPIPYGGRLTPGCGNLMIERTVFERVGVFERTVDGRGEDTDLFSRIEQAGIAAWYIPLAIVHHLTPSQRLEPGYLLSLSRRMGAGIALRQSAAMSRGRFALLSAAKAMRLATVHVPLLLVAAALNDHEAWLGRRCLAAIEFSFLRGAIGNLLATRPASPGSSAANAGARPLLSPPLSMPPLSPNSATEIFHS